MSRFVVYDKEKSVLFCTEQWILVNLDQIERKLDAITPADNQKLIIDGEKLDELDSGGALLITQWRTTLDQQGIKAEFQNLQESHQHLIELITEKEAELEDKEEPKKEMDIISRFGKNTVERVLGGMDLLGYIGELVIVFNGVLFKQRDLQWRSLLRAIYDAGYRALPILALLSFLIGVVMAYQLGLQLKNYGANIYIVNLSGMAILREFGPLITAIIVAGRTGSAFTAQIGLMKVNEEIDALNTMGLSPQSRIAIPRIMGVIIVMPLLTIWSNAFGVLGSMVMAQNMLGISMGDFISRFNEVIELSNLWTGLAKTPVFGLAIGTVSCFQGFRVSYTAESIGLRTTMSVVQSLFLIIVIDAIFSLLYSWAKL